MNFFSDIIEWLPAQLTLLGALFVAFYRLVFGWLVPNLTVSVTTDREAADEKTDHLRLAVRLDKGSREGLHIKDLVARITPLRGGRPDYAGAFHCQIFGWDRIEDDIDGQAVWTPWDRCDKCHTVLLRPYGLRKRMPAKLEPMHIGPDEACELAAYTIVESKVVYLVEVVCIVRHLPSLVWYGRHIQWRTSAISLPVLPDKK
ncbi:MAG: hypothetical protein U1F81_24585 [Verrucomicrobiaceae bacterium]